MKETKTWNKKNVVKMYAGMDWISTFEVRLLQEVKPTWSMLDIGVGAGRTTIWFWPKVDKYIGIDYAPNMIEQCKDKFSGIDFEVMDARRLYFFDNSFDFVLFSFNGIDYISCDEREQAFREIHRVLKPGGLFVFSSHDMAWFDELPFISRLKYLPLTESVYNFAIELNMKQTNRWLDGTARTCFVDIDWQIQQLKDIGFEVLATEPQENYMHFKCRKVR